MELLGAGPRTARPLLLAGEATGSPPQGCGGVSRCILASVRVLGELSPRNGVTGYLSITVGMENSCLVPLPGVLAHWAWRHGRSG